MVTTAKVVSYLNVPDQTLFVCEGKLHHQICPCWFFNCLYQKVVINAPEHQGMVCGLEATFSCL